jgi:prepilin-type N-terminal cleavage/methylation domain-containing protein
MALHRTSAKQSGFTLVELAIVLVIIGLIIGGVLVGQDLIKVAIVRAATTDIEKTNAGATAFLSKYSGLPGDLMNAKAKEFGFINSSQASVVGRDGTAGKGDGNGVIEGCSLNGQAFGCEMALFWVDLGTAQLVRSQFTTYDGTATTVANITLSTIPNYVPKMRMRESSNMMIVPISGRNYFYVSAITTGAAGVIATTPAITTGEARLIDEKLDDAFPTTGTVQSYTFVAGVPTADPGAAVSGTTCMDSVASTASRYNVIPANINAINCQLLIRASF